MSLKIFRAQYFTWQALALIYERIAGLNTQAVIQARIIRARIHHILTDNTRITICTIARKAIQRVHTCATVITGSAHAHIDLILAPSICIPRRTRAHKSARSRVHTQTSIGAH